MVMSDQICWLCNKISVDEKIGPSLRILSKLAESHQVSSTVVTTLRWHWWVVAVVGGGWHLLYVALSLSTCSNLILT